jgi:hypothetical protein
MTGLPPEMYALHLERRTEGHHDRWQRPRARDGRVASLKAEWTNDDHQRAGYSIWTRFRDSGLHDDA